ncbi:MAG TPA: NAD(P)-binding domain-containing protein [Micromonosporaceae bacterium]|nr:NAD(P)-binding domain-containing protein [Micromonosporaceae bacterium]
MTQVAIIGAGPYGLSIAAHLRSRGVAYRIFGTPVDTWRRHMPAGMTLKSDGFASSLSDPDGKGTLGNYCTDQGIAYHHTDLAVSLEVFNAYALDFQQRFVPDLEDRQVVSVERSGGSFTISLEDGEMLDADFVVGAVGITHFGFVPPELAHLRAELVSHSSAHHDLSRFAGREVTVVGGGSSAVDVAALLAEAGATTSLVARRSTLRFFSEPKPGSRSRWQRIRHPSSGLGPGWRSWLCENVPNLFRFLPGNARLTIIRRHLGPKSAWVMKARLEAGVSVSLGETVERAVEDDGRVRLHLVAADGSRREVLTDHVIAATGYWPDVQRLWFLSEGLRGAIRTHARMPVVSGSFESSVPGLYFVGPPAVNSFGPLMRFMVGAEYVAPLVARRLARRARRTEPVRSMAPA